jgi:hypothetical protein
MGHPEQDRQNQTGKTGQTEQDCGDRTGERTASTGEPELHSHNSTVRTDIQNRTGRTRQDKQEKQNKTAGIGLPGKDRQEEISRQGRRIGLPVEGCQDGTARIS